MAGVSVAVLATSAIAPPAIAAAQAPTPPDSGYQTRGLLDDLLGTVGDLLSGLLGQREQDQLAGLLGLLQGGSAPTTELLRPLTDILDQLGGSSGLPLPTRDLINQVTGLLQSGRAGEELAPALLAPVADLLRQLAGTDGLPAPAAGLLTQLADLLAGAGSGAGLPLDDLNLLPDVIDGLNRVLVGLETGNGTPTADLLAQLIPLLRQVAAAPLPQALRDLVNQLIELLENTTGSLDPLLTTQISTVLRLIGNTPGVDRETRTIIERTTTILDRSTGAGAGGSGGAGGGGGTNGTGNGTGTGGTGGTGLTVRRAATARDKAVIKRVGVNKKKTIASVRIACPSGAPAVCSTTLRAAVAGKSSKVITTRIGQNTSKLVKLKLTKKATKQLKRRGGSVSVVATTAFGTQKFSAKATLKVKKTKAKARR
ncbi:MAG TPA: hypothetical protein VLK58_17730 [Conexibacter sp.]|nr:hypothetical protein [Conexibacter sp.]